MLVIFGVEHNIKTDGVMDLVVLLAKVYIYRSKTIQNVPTLIPLSTFCTVFELLVVGLELSFQCTPFELANLVELPPGPACWWSLTNAIDPLDVFLG